MPGGRVRSARSDTSDGDEATVEKELELQKLKRQLRIMENDAKAYVQESQDTLQRHRKEIEVLMKERKEIVTDMSLIDSETNQRKNEKYQETLEKQAHGKLSVQEEIDNEKKNHDELKTEIRKWERKNEEQNKKMGGVNMSAQHQMMIGKKTRKMEDQLLLANNKFSKKLECNRKLREEIDSMRVERKRFDELYKKLDRELQELKQEIGEVIDTSTNAYDSRDEAQTKMIILKEKSDKDIQSHNAEMKELLRIIEHDRKLREFMMCKGKERPEDAQLVMWRQRKEAIEAEKKRMSQTDSVESYQEAYMRIKEITGEEDMNQIVKTFIDVQDRNFAMFTFVNEQNNETEMLQEQIQDIHAEIEDFQAQGVQMEAERQQILKRLEEKQGASSKAANEYDERHKGVMKILDQLRAGIDSLFNKVNADKEAIDDMLGTNVGVTDQNMLQYLGLIEGQVNRLLLMQAYIQSQKDDDYPKKPQSLLGQGPQAVTSQQSTLKIAPPAVGDDYDSDGSNASDDNAQPLSNEQLMSKAMKSVIKQETQARKEGFRYDLSEASTKGKKKEKGKK